MYSFMLKEENGVGFTIERMEHINFFYSTDTISMDTFTADDVRAWGDDPEIKPYGVYQMNCGINAKTPLARRTLSARPFRSGGQTRAAIN